MGCDTGGDGATTRARRMKKGENKKQTSHPLAEYDRPDGQTGEQLMQELNILKLEGCVFCFDPKQAKKRAGKRTVGELASRPITIEPHTTYGQPSVLAYKVLQAILLKTTTTTYPYPQQTIFSKRELARIIGRTWNGTTAQQLFNALMQLQSQIIHCAIYEKKSKRTALATFSIVNAVYSVLDDNKVIEVMAVDLDRRIITSLNQRHVAYINWDRIRTLDVIGMVAYKRVYYHLCNNWNPHRGMQRRALYFHKDYEDICAEWYGGVRPEKYVSAIKRKHIGARLDDLVRVGLLDHYDIERKRDGRYKIVFWPAAGFFEDYDEYYVNRKRRQPGPADQMVDGIQQAIEAVAYFHKLLGHDHNQFQEKETGYAAHLLQTLTAPELRDLIDYAVARAGETRFDPQWFNAISTYVEPWKLDRERRRARQARRDEIATCPHCDTTGMLQVKTPTGAYAATECPHDSDKIAAFEERSQLRRV